MKTLAEFIHNFSEPGYEAMGTREDGIPYLMLYTAATGGPRVITFAAAMRLAKKVQDEMQCPVHFHSLETEALNLFVFDDTLSYSTAQREEYGILVDDWIRLVTES